MISYVLAFLAATTNATSNVLNRKASRQEPAQEQFRPALIIGLLHRPAWLAAVGTMIVSFVVSAAALGTGEIAAVQPVIVLELPMTLIGGSMLLGGRLGRREWAAVAAMTAGVIGLLVALDPHAGSSASARPLAWIIGSAANGGAVLALFFAARYVGRRPGREAAEAALLGVGAGLGYGLAAAYTKGLTMEFSTGGILGVVTSWPIYAAIGAGATATWLLQNSYHAGRLAAGQPGITLADPLAGMAWGIIVFHERVRGPVFYGVAVIPLLVLAAGVLVLSRSPLLLDNPQPAESGERASIPARDK